MKNKKIIYSSIIILSIISLILAGIIFNSQSQKLKIIFLDVGQGDAILIEQGSNQILIDGGPSEQILMEKLGRFIPFWDRTIEAVIATHPDQDHIEGLLGVMKKYKVGALLEAGTQSESRLYKKYEELIAQKQIKKILTEAGMKIKLNQAEMEILSPREKTSIGIVKNTNDYSVTTKLVFGQNSFLFTGDLPDNEELRLIQERVDLSANILKVAHHGSKYSTINEFLEKVNPETAIISVGKNNRYGHPTPEVLQRLQERNINVFRTDEQGDIEYECQGPNDNCQIIAN